MFHLPKQQIHKCDGTADLSKPVKRSGANQRKARVEASAEAPISIKPKEAKPVRTKIGARLASLVMERDKYACVLCGSRATPSNPLQIGHIQPVIQGGTNCDTNLRVECRRCNLGGGARKRITPIDNSKIVSQLAAIVGKKNKKGR